MNSSGNETERLKESTTYWADKQMNNKFLTARPILLCSHAVPVLKKTFLVESFKFNSLYSW